MKNYVLVKEKQLEKLLDAIADTDTIGVVEYGPQSNGNNPIIFENQAINIVGVKKIWVEKQEPKRGGEGFERDPCDKI
jgi:hypothetical protein